MGKKLLLFGFLSFFLTGCATILNDDNQMINISSTKASFKGTIDGVPFQGPGIVPVKRGEGDRIVRIETKGCQKEVLLASTVDPKVFINLISGGTTGGLIDYSSGKMWKYQSQLVIPCQ